MSKSAYFMAQQYGNPGKGVPDLGAAGGAVVSAVVDVLARDPHTEPRVGDEVIVNGNVSNRITVLAVTDESVTWTRENNNYCRNRFTSTRQEWQEGRSYHRDEAARFTLAEIPA